jgi:hypothetical protein
MDMSFLARLRREPGLGPGLARWGAAAGAGEAAPIDGGEARFEGGFFFGERRPQGDVLIHVGQFHGASYRSLDRRWQAVLLPSA